MDQLQDDFLSSENELRIESETSGYLIETAKWAKFIAIAFFVCTGLVIFFVLVYGSNLTSLYSTRRYSSYGDEYARGVFFGIVIALILVAAVVGVTYYFLLNFANKMRAGIASENTEQVNQGLRSLKVHFIIIGILLMLGILATLYNISKL